MKITCSHCKSGFAVPDEKIPKDKKVKLRCPKCTNVITIGGTTAVQLQQVPKQQTEPQQPLPSAISTGQESKEEDSDLDLLELERQLAIGMPIDVGVGQQFKASVEELGYKYVEVSDTNEAIERMRFHQFNLIIFCEGFGNQKLTKNPVLEYFNTLPMSVRRQMSLAVIGEKLQTMNTMQSYALSANVVINIKDIDRLTSILKRTMAENKRFYKVFMDTLKEVGKM